jgi:hypothetical protein
MVGFMAKGRPAGLVEDEDARAARLLDAQAKAVELWTGSAGSAASTRNCSTWASDRPSPKSRR